jgi:hypothetical protein
LPALSASKSLQGLLLQERDLADRLAGRLAFRDLPRRDPADDLSVALGRWQGRPPLRSPREFVRLGASLPPPPVRRNRALFNGRTERASRHTSIFSNCGDATRAVDSRFTLGFALRVSTLILTPLISKQYLTHVGQN